MNIKINIKITIKESERKLKRRRQRINLNLRFSLPTLISEESPKLGLAYSAVVINKAIANKRRIRIINIYDNKISLRTYY